MNASQFNNADCGDGNITFFYNNLTEGTYYIPVLADGNTGSIGAYNVTVTVNACPINYDLCSATPPQALASGTPLIINANNANAGSAGDWATGNIFEGTPVNWHRFTTTECLDVSVAYCGTSPAFGQTLGLVPNACPADQLTYYTGTNTTACGDGNATLLYNDLPAGTWYVPVINNPGQSASGPYTLTISGVQCNIGMDEPARVIAALFPNPSDGPVRLLSTVSGPARITFLDVTGRMLRTERINLSAGQVTEISLAQAVPPGSYALRVEHASGSETLRLQVR